ncbi:transporter substrate-binding domain-containing protein [Mitsuokella jalaludinii]|uniref:transporter substrate-binding domain-containing protein n=1 Tax=Mitsuokella jalaludinii TaxID=187979 RepID=UPI003F95E859
MRKNFGKYDETNIKSNKKYNLEGLPASGILRVATPGDYRPMACWEPRLQAYRGFDIELVRSLAAALGLGVTFCRTSWQRLETEARHAAFDLAVGGISRTQERVATLTVSAGYLATGKTILCRRGEEARFSDLAAINRADVRVVCNPGGTNEAFVRRFLPQADVRLFPENAAIPGEIAAGRGDVMLTETVEAAYYIRRYPGLMAPLLQRPFSRGEFCFLFGRDFAPAAGQVDRFLASFRQQGMLQRLTNQYLS